MTRYSPQAWQDEAQRSLLRSQVRRATAGERKRLLRVDRIAWSAFALFASADVVIYALSRGWL